MWFDYTLEGESTDVTEQIYLIFQLLEFLPEIGSREKYILPHLVLFDISEPGFQPWPHV